MTKWQKMIWTACFLVLLAAFQGCSSVTPSQVEASGTNGDGSRIASISETLIGTPYRFGGDTRKGFDCSGLVRYVYGQIGLKVPRTSRRLYQQAKKVPLEKLQPGDLLFFRIRGKAVSHVAIYTQNNHFIHAPSSTKSVSKSSLNSRYWSSRLVGAGRFW